MKKFSNILLMLFAKVFNVCLFAGGLSVVGYLVGDAIGGAVAADLCALIFKTYLPWVIKFTSIFAGIGLIGMYLSKQRALVADNNNK